MSDNDSHDRRPRAFFGRRKGHALKRTQEALFETLLPRLAIDLASPASKSLAELFPHRPEEAWLEIGFGGGEHLIARAKANPEVGFIGIEPFINGMGKALVAIDANGLSNIRLHFGDAIDLLAWLPDGVLAGVDLLYPDPWPKKRHWKRRFVQDETVASIARVVKRGGIFRFASDIPHYVAWTLERLLRSPDFSWTAERADDWRLPWAGWVETRYEAKAKREGRTPAYLTFRRNEK
ncbi:MAG: tRNA (guanosine(46)-N7)-methyltransferase TrmB [Xanthobacteraceae bacterium]